MDRFLQKREWLSLELVCPTELQTKLEEKNFVAKQETGFAKQEIEISSDYKGWSTLRRGEDSAHGPFSLTIRISKRGDEGPIRVEVKGAAFNGEITTLKTETWMNIFGQEVLTSKDTLENGVDKDFWALFGR